MAAAATENITRMYVGPTQRQSAVVVGPTNEELEERKKIQQNIGDGRLYGRGQYN